MKIIHFIISHWFKIILLIAIIILISMLTAQKTPQGSKKQFFATDVSSLTQITCTYPQILNANYLNNEISHNFPAPETHPLIFTFSKLDDPKMAQLSYIDATQSITNVPILKVSEDEEKIMYIELSERHLTVHTIYKKSGVSLYSKSLDLLGIPTGSLAMGSCVGY